MQSYDKMDSMQQENSCTVWQDNQAALQALELKKQFLDSNQAHDGAMTDSNNNIGFRNDKEDQFSLLECSHELHNKPMPDETVQIFCGPTASLFGHSARDQFADALLRLQVDLESSSSRLDELESKLKGPTRPSSKGVSASSSSDGKGLMTTLAFFGWPILVYVAMRAVERRLYVSAEK